MSTNKEESEQKDKQAETESVIIVDEAKQI